MTLPEGEKHILLHTCCAPCSSAILEYMLAAGLRPVVFYFNPNIFPQEEYEKRKAECTRHARSLGVEIADGDYTHAHWLTEMRGMEDEPERGKRCRKCFELRLCATARYAQEKGFRMFATTLTASRWKDTEQVHEAGRKAAEMFPPTVFWERNWRKGGLDERRRELLKEHRFYNQLYCGCEFSMKRI